MVLRLSRDIFGQVAFLPKPAIAKFTSGSVGLTKKPWPHGTPIHQLDEPGWHTHICDWMPLVYGESYSKLDLSWAVCLAQFSK